jgi:hypothetical protein
LGDGREIGRSGQEKLSWPVILINGQFDSGQQIRHALDFVDDERARFPADKSERIGLRGLASHGVIKRYIINRLVTQLLCQGRLPALSRA